MHHEYLDFMPKLFDAVRNKFGFNEHLLHDMHHRLTPIEAARFGKSIEDYRMFWMEDPTPAENQECFRLIRQHTVTPIAVGEVFNSIWDCKQLIEEGDKPGLGIEFDEKLAAKYPYEPAYLPVARLEDGTLWNR